MKHHIPDLTLVLPCYNETPVFVGSVALIASILDDSKLSYEILFVDDGSTDGTVELIKKTVSRFPRTMRAQFHTQNAGRGKTVADGIDGARGNVVGYIDIDCEVSPVYIPHIVRMIMENHADGVIGERIYRSSLGSLLREVLSVGYKWLVRTALPTGMIDTESGYKFFNRKKILPVVSHTRDMHWFWDTEIIVRSRLAGLRMRQVPVLFLRRFDKVSSVHIVSDTLSYLRSIVRLRRQLISEGISL